MNWGYIAGLIDGEGHLGIVCRVRPSGCPVFEPVIRIVNTHKEALDIICAFLGGYVTVGKWAGVRPHEHTLYHLAIHRKDRVQEILEKCLPFFIIKKDQAKILLEFVQLRIDKSRKGLPRGMSLVTEKEFELYKAICLSNAEHHGKGRGPKYERWQDFERQVKLAELGRTRRNERCQNHE